MVASLQGKAAESDSSVKAFHRGFPGCASAVHVFVPLKGNGGNKSVRGLRSRSAQREVGGFVESEIKESEPPALLFQRAKDGHL